MSILSGRAIAEAVHQGRITIDPYDPKYLNPASYDLTLGTKVGTYFHAMLDARRDNPYSVIELEEMYLVPGQLYLMHTTERVGAVNLVPELHGKSSIGRLGVCIHLTAGHGDPGFLGQWTLEVTCVRPVMLYAGMRIAQMLFHTVEIAASERNVGPMAGGIVQYAGNYVGSAAEGPVPSMSWKQFA